MIVAVITKLAHAAHEVHELAIARMALTSSNQVVDGEHTCSRKQTVLCTQPGKIWVPH